MKKILEFVTIFTILASILSGCLSSGKKTGGNQYYPSQTNSLVGDGFNEEVYVWEGFIFSTNRVNSVK